MDLPKSCQRLIGFEEHREISSPFCGWIRARSCEIVNWKQPAGTRSVGSVYIISSRLDVQLYYNGWPVWIVSKVVMILERCHWIMKLGGLKKISGMAGYLAE